MSKTDFKEVGVELAKTVVGFGVARIAVVQGKKMLKVNEETDLKKKKLKEAGLGGAVAAIGVVGAVKAPVSVKSVFAGMATAGVVAAATPYAKDDEGFIPALHGHNGVAAIEDADLSDYEQEIEEEETDELNALEELEEYENEFEDDSEYTDAEVIEEPMN